MGPKAASCVQSSRCVISGRAVKRRGRRQARLQIMVKLGAPGVGALFSQVCLSLKKYQLL